MAEKQQIKATVVKVLCYVEKVSSFASSINPLFGIVTSVVGVVKKGLVDEEVHEMHKDFQQIHEKLESISEKNKEVLQKIRRDEINEKYGKHQEAINHQYKAFNNMVEGVKEHPENSDDYMQQFVKICREDKMDQSLNVFYRGVMGTAAFSPTPILQVYLDNCDRNKKKMEACCFRLAHLFYIGLMTLMAYTAITEGDKEKVRDKWGQNVIVIQAKMQEALDQCTEEN
ncbi:hypothetical protein DPX16_6826 [Anabarilius grahami]|uniref:Uncharacterized protein n=1 Tax=Anabarilius grahami TaxID=495550 RepID=A0A3N0Y6N4_ANAGA|nr:hypothetical protein DPX16_6826 [Anabarilius grahami]